MKVRVANVADWISTSGANNDCQQKVVHQPQKRNGDVSELLPVYSPRRSRKKNAWDCKVAVFVGCMRSISYMLDHGDWDGFDSVWRRVFLGVSSELSLQTEVDLALTS